MRVNSEILEKFVLTNRHWWAMSKEHRDYILCKEVYHCTPWDIDNQDEFVLQLHWDFYMAEKEEDYYKAKREEMLSNK